MVLVDSNVLIDVLSGDPKWSEWSREKLDEAIIDGLRINLVIYAEIAPQFSRPGDLDAFLSTSNVRLLELTRPHMFLAGVAHRRHRRAGGDKKRVLADFMIGAQAIVERCTILTRDPKIFRSYFPTVELITP